MTHASLSESHRLAIRLLRSYHQVDTLGRYLAFLSGVSEEHILSIDNAAAKELLRDAIVGYTEELHDAVQISSMAKGKGRASDVTCAGGTSQVSVLNYRASVTIADDYTQVVTEAQTRIFAANRGVKGAPKNMLTLGVSGVSRVGLSFKTSATDDLMDRARRSTMMPHLHSGQHHTSRPPQIPSLNPS